MKNLDLVNIRKQSEKLDNKEIIATVKCFFATKIELVKEVTARDIFEMKALNYNFIIL